MADTAAKQQAATDLQKGVTLDANGQPAVATPQNSIILGKAGEDYHALMVQGIRSSLQSGVTSALSEMHQKFITDPDGYQSALGAYVQQQRTNPNVPPEVANALATQAANESAQHLANLREQTVRHRQRLQGATQALAR